jgi:putative ABC transport system permease protein
MDVLLDSLLRDFHFACRILRRNVGFATVAVFTLGLAVGTNTAMFSVAESILWKPLPFFRPDQLVEVYEKTPQQHWLNVSGPDFLDWRARNKVFAQLAAYGWSSRQTVAAAGLAEQVDVSLASANLFKTLGVQTTLGRDFLPEEESGGRTDVAILSHDLWERDFGLKADVFGKRIRLNDDPYTIVGVLPPVHFEIESNPEIFVPFDFTSANLQRRDKREFIAIGRLKNGVSLAQARSDMQNIARRIALDHPATNQNFAVGIDPLREAVTGWSRTSLLLFLGATFVLLLIACANLANLVLSRALSRQGEFAIRLAQGAGRAALGRQLLIEVLTLGALGGTLGLFSAAWGVKLFIAALPADYLPRMNDIGVDVRVFFFAFGVALAMAASGAIVPAGFASRVDLNVTLKEAGRALANSSLGRRSRRLLVSAEVALAMVLLFGASLFINSYIRLHHVDVGFDRNNLLALEVSTAPKHLPPQQISLFYSQLLARLRAIPGTRAVVAASSGPFRSMEVVRFRLESRPLPEAANIPEALYRIVTAGYFNGLKIALLRGRDFDSSDTLAGPHVAIINTNLAHQYCPSEDPIGKRLIIVSGDEGIHLGAVEIVGVAANTREVGLNEVPFGDVYLPFSQHPVSSMEALIRTAVPPTTLAHAVRSALRIIDPAAPVGPLESIDARIEHSLDTNRINMLLLESFALIAGLLAAVGLFGVISQSVTQRTHDIGVRMALGARAADATRFVMADSLRMTLAGVAAGVGISLLLGQLLGGTLYLVPYQHNGLIYQVSVHDPLMIGMASATLIALSLVAAYLPARRAARIDPMVALRYE